MSAFTTVPTAANAHHQRHQSRVAEPASAGHLSRLSRLKDPQVWVCAIAAFTLIGLSTGMLDPVEPGLQAKASNATQAAARSVAPAITLASNKP